MLFFQTVISRTYCTSSAEGLGFLKRATLVFHLGKRNWYSHVPLINSMGQSGIEIDLIPSWRLQEDLARAKGKHSIVMCCISYLTTQLGPTRKLVASIRESHGDGVVLIAGGPHPSGDPQEALDSGFDYVVRGEGELVLPRLVAQVIAGDPELKNHRVLTGEPIPDLDRFSPISFKHNLYPPIEITRGCLFDCQYCSVPSLGGTLRHRSVESVLDAAQGLLSLRGTWDFRFISPNSLGYGSAKARPDESAIENLLSSLGDLRGRKRIFFATFPSEARPDFVTEGIVELIRELADNDSINMGAQSGSKRILDQIHRGHDLDTVFRACEMVIAGGLVPIVDFILGMPGETPHDQTITLEAMRKVTQMGGEVRIHHFLPLAGSGMAGMSPTPIPGKVMREIGRMSLRGQASGSFTQQMKLARQILRWQDLSSSSREVQR